MRGRPWPSSCGTLLLEATMDLSQPILPLALRIPKQLCSPLLVSIHGICALTHLL